MPFARVFPSLCLALALMAGAAWAAPPPSVQNEIEHLLRYLETSGCAFYRNGRWHDAPAARAHIEKKYDYLRKRDRVETTEAFIERAASQSSMSGEVYRVKCDGAVTDSGAWLRAELRRYRGVKRRAR